MHRIDGSGATPDNRFTEGDPVAGSLATQVTDDWANAVQEEICNVIEGAGIALNKGSNAQLIAAIKALADSVIPAGSMMQRAVVTTPSGWLKCNGQAVSRTTYARLFAAIGTTFGAGNGTTTFTLPDMRGEFARGLDEGRGVDPGRTLGSFQDCAIENITGSIGPTDHGPSGTVATGAFSRNGPASTQVLSDSSFTNSSFTFDASRVVKTAAETRPRNKAFPWFIKT